MGHIIKRSVFFFSLLLLCLVALYPKAILFKLIEWKLDSYCTQVLGAQFKKEGLKIEEGKIVFENGELTKGDRLRIQFDKASFKPSFSFKKREIGGDLSFEQLKIEHRKNNTFYLQNPFTSRSSFLKLKLHTSIEGGHLLLYDERSGVRENKELKFDLNHRLKDQSSCGFVALSWGSECQKWTADFQKKGGGPLNVSTQFYAHSIPDLAHLFRHCFESSLPESLLNWTLLDGTVDGHLTMELAEQVPIKVRGEVQLQQLQAENTTLEIFGELDSMHCDVDLDFSHISEINGECHVRGGRLGVQEDEMFWKEIWDLKNLQADLCVKDGSIESSQFQGSFLGMEGEFALDWNAHDVLMKMGFRGSASSINSLLPDSYQKQFEQAFSEDFVSVDASVKRSGKGLELDGLLSIFEEEKLPYELVFGCLFGSKGADDGSSEIVPELIPSPVSDSIDAFLDNLKDQFCLSQKRFGWFKGKNFPLEKFFFPFLLHHLSMEGGGLADFEGSFDERYMVIFYDVQQACLESPRFSVCLDTAKRKESGKVQAVHYLDLWTWDHVGFMPVKNGRYTHNRFDLQFEEATAMIYFENNFIDIQNINCSIEEIDLHGEVKLTLNSLDDIDLKIRSDHFLGSASSAQKFLSHFNQSIFWEIPVEGEIAGDEDALFFHYHFCPSATLLVGYVNSELSFTAQNSLFSLEDYQAQVVFDWKERYLKLKNGEGTLVLPKLERSLSVFTPSMTLSELPGCLYSLDLMIKDGEEIVLDLKGDSQRVGDAKELFASGTTKKEGQTFALKAVQDQKNLKLIEANLGQWCASGELCFQDHQLLIENMACFLNSQSGVVFSGVYDRLNKSLKCDVQRLEWNLADLDENQVALWKPKGTLGGLGTLTWEVGGKVEAYAYASFENFECGGVHFGSGEDLRCFYSSDYGISVEGLEVEIPFLETVEKYKLGRFYYDLHSQKILFEEFDFTLPPEKLSELSEAVCTLFPGKIPPVILDCVESLKQDGPLEGRVSLEVHPDNMWVYLNLKDGEYHFLNQDLHLKDFQLVYDPLQLNIWTRALYQDAYYWFHLNTDSMTISHGQLAVCERPLSPDIPEGIDSLTATWERRSEKGWCIRALEGSFSGIHAGLYAPTKMDFSSQIELKGRLGLEPEKILPLLSAGWQTKLNRFLISGSYELIGDLTLDKQELSTLSFLGNMSGSECGVGKIYFDRLDTEIDLKPEEIKISNFEIQDWAGKLAINEAALKNREQKWSVWVDQLDISNVRLSRLKSPWTRWNARTKPFFCSLFIPSLELRQFEGILTDPSTFLGSGSVEFTNLPKKTFFSNLLFLPAEITARIGLDLTTFIPARGTIDYTIEKSKVNLNEFKNMYSNGKHSKFYLAEGKPAYIDFEGHLNLKVKMKQYNLLMKLAEFFTCSIKGTVKKPTYTFSNQIDDDN